MSRVLHYCWLTLWYSFATLTVLVAAAFSIARILLPQIEQYNVHIEQFATDIIGQPVKIQSLNAEWHGAGPSLVLNNVRLMGEDEILTVAQFSKISLSFGVIESIKLGQLSFSNLAISGTGLSFVRRADGQIILAGFGWTELNSQGNADYEELLNWAIGQGRLSIEIKNLLFEDQLRGGRNYHFSNVSAVLRNQGGHHLIDVVVNAPDNQGRKLTVAMDVVGNVLQTGGWSGKMYLEGNRVDLAQLIGEQAILDWRLKIGVSDFSIWGVVENAQLQSLRGEIELNDVDITLDPQGEDIITDAGGNKAPDNRPAKGNNSKPRHRNYDQLAGRFDWQRHGQTWKVAVDEFVIKQQESFWPPTRIAVDYKPTIEAGAAVRISSSYLRFMELREIMHLVNIDDAPGLGSIKQINPQGVLRNFYLHWYGDAANHYKIAADLENIGVLPWRKMPGFKGLSGKLVMDQHSGMFTLTTRSAVLHWPGNFRDRMTIRSVTGDIYWRKGQETWFVDSRNLAVVNRDIDAVGLLQLKIPTTSDQSPFINMIINIKNGVGKRLSAYLPVDLIDPQTVAWLDKAITAGDIKSGGAILHGDMKDFPFDHGEGVFEVRLDMENGKLDYAESWPPINDMDGEIVFRGRNMDIDVTEAKIFGSRIFDTTVSLPNMGQRPLVLSIKGYVLGATQEKLDYMQQSPPLNKVFGHFLDEATATGDSLLHLDLDIIFNHDISSKVAGSITFYDNSINIQPVGTVLSHLNGTLEFRPGNVQGQDISSELLGQPSDFFIKTLENDIHGRHVSIRAKGDFEAADLSRRYLPVVKDLVAGGSEWDMTLNIPLSIDGDKKNNKKRPISIVLETDLQGTSIRLPVPFKKETKQKLKTKIRIALMPQGQLLIRFSYGGRFDGIYETKTVAGESFNRGELRFGGGPVSLPQGEGIRLVGKLKTFDVGIWQTLAAQVNEKRGTELRKQVAEPAARQRSTLLTEALHSADLNVEDFIIFGQHAKQLRLRVKSEGENLVVNVNSQQFSGTIKVPNQLDREPIEMDLDHWRLTSMDRASQSPLDPRDIPAIRAYCKSVTYGKRKFGSVRLITTKLADGLRVEQLEVKLKSTVINGRGKWIVSGGEQKSEFKFKLESENLGETLDDLDYAGSIKGGRGQIEVKLVWPGPLTEVDLEHLQGDVKLYFESGRLVEIDPGGAGRRMLGLLSLQALPRRLLLDFSDLFADGLSFDVISGDFKLDDGDAYTTNLIMKGPGMDAATRGRIGLIAQDYDQIATVTVHVADIASFIALVAAAGPWAIILPQLLKSGLDKASAFRYTVTGSWDNPKVEPIVEVYPEDEDEDW